MVKVELPEFEDTGSSFLSKIRCNILEDIKTKNKWAKVDEIITSIEKHKKHIIFSTGALSFDRRK